MEIIQRVVKDHLPISEVNLQFDNMGETDLLSSVVVKFSSKATQETIDWLIGLIQAPVSSGGAYLLASLKSDDPADPGRTFYITATYNRLLHAAEEFKVTKLRTDGEKAEFLYQDRHLFSEFHEEDSHFLTSAEKQYLIKQCLNTIVVTDIESIPGVAKATIYKDRPVVPRCLAYKVITLFPLHNFEKLKSMEKKWYANFQKWDIPVDVVRDYFGETVALYFAFLGFYTKFLIPICLVALFHKFFVNDEQKEENAWFAALNLIWTTVFLEIWKRRCCTISFEWGTLSRNKDESLLVEQPRAEFKGQKRISPITGLPEPYYPTWKRRAKMYCVSFPLLLLCLVFAVFGMWLYLDFQQILKNRYHHSTGIIVTIVMKVPSILYGAAIYVLNTLYSKYATKLNDWENHRLASSYNNSLIVKLVLFHSVNSFISLFYIAFYLHDMELLREHLATLLVTQQIIQQIQESLIPYLMFQRHNVKIEKEGKKISLKRDQIKDSITRQEKLPVYQGTFADYLEMYIQFGYVFLFSAAYPLAAFWALLNNMIEIRSDAFKLCRLHQRPFFESASSIGAWQAAFEVMGVVAVITNCSLIAMSHSTMKWFEKWSTSHYILLFVFIEHLIIGAKILLSYMIPDIPGWITKKMAKIQYEKTMLLKKQ